jgi:hypothetical protein
MGGSRGSCGGGALLLALLAPEMLSFRAGDAVVAVLCDQRFTLAASWAALERRRVLVDGAASWFEAAEAVWGDSALAAAAMLAEAALARASPGCSDRLLLRLTCELLREPVRDGRRRCVVPDVLLAGALMLVRGEAAVCLRPRRCGSCTASRLGAGTRWQRRRRRRRGTGVLWA